MNAGVAQRPWLPYVVPFTVYMLFLVLQSRWEQGLAWLYPLKTVAVAATLLAFARYYEELSVPLGRRPSASRQAETDAAGARPESEPRPHLLGGLLLAVAVGVVVIGLWIGIDPYYPKLNEMMAALERWLGVLWREQATAPSPSGKPFNPFTLGGGVATWTFIVFRVVGAVLVVPVMEELFWRAFLIRWLINEDFKKVPVGAFSWPSFAITVAMFGAEHNEWLAGLLAGVLYNWLLYRRKNVGWCVVAHAVSNAVLAAWVLIHRDWKLW